MGFSYWNGTRYGKLNWPLLRHCFPWISSEARETCHGSWRNYRHQARDWSGSDLSKKHLSLSRINCNMRTSGRLVRRLGHTWGNCKASMAEEAVGGDLFWSEVFSHSTLGVMMPSISLSQWLNLKPFEITFNFIGKPRLNLDFGSETVLKSDLWKLQNMGPSLWHVFRDATMTKSCVSIIGSYPPHGPVLYRTLHLYHTSALQNWFWWNVAYHRFWPSIITLHPPSVSFKTFF